jgi:homoserine kinase
MSIVSVRVPCSTSNLGAGFDCIGLALNRYLTATLHLSDAPLQIERTGTLADLADEKDDLVVKAMRHLQVEPQGRLILDSNIPVGRGLGSSGAAIVAGLMLAAKLSRKQLDRHDLGAHATFLEGHPDNALPSAQGGLMAGITGGDGRSRSIFIHQLRLASNLGFCFAAPHAVVSTKAARRALPENVPHETAARSVARTVALVEGLASGNGDLLRIGFSDELHVPYRLPMIPGGEAAMRAAEAGGAYAATISGSGSGLIAVCPVDKRDRVVTEMRKAFEHATRTEAIAFVVEVDEHGAQFLDK